MEKLFWSIALPGFGQLLNGNYIKAIVFIFLEFLINVQANFNKVILLSFHGRIEEAIQQTNYRWLMFCLMYVIPQSGAIVEERSIKKSIPYLGNRLFVL